ncbi:hypothetical protein ABB37_00348 [Leptomonas pyrrhocoris]|uniref:Uncharacterized protein n=1 Tax=Leptomonas pyrrhocoris TaxID=157538 RepID=A0A0N0VHN0_LEPPY|nr:hypothetical protein ABB37_00348 [Leptomonas pyrrhocoris]XP_015664521.1 hypothetical protein ABB37_00348 [Leptomonas pyrrhocoris]KPA86081.1 hypothetical protein ABB37_00348 [Leptomonas pyrrhocoris]KPA86082.1 hypothetical protein ABB37_00348 [Leptomonas pyrrhocoris]|eukprot:XP_015664520.1 hypothetical protein ABB37_00348 [Leptomonas pyrrhocoris]
MLYGSPQPAPVAEGTSASCCSDLREMNEAKVANILSYLDSAAVVPISYEKLSHNSQNLRDVTNVTNSTSSAIPLTASALQHVTGFSPSSSSSIAPLPEGWHRNSAADAGAGATGAIAALPSVNGSAFVPAPALAWITGGGAESAQNTYLGIRKRIEGLQFEKEQLQHDNDDLRSRLQLWRSEEQQRKAEMREAVQAEMEELQKGLAKERRRAKAEGEKADKMKAELTRQVDALTVKLREETARRAEETRRLEAANAAAISSLRTKWAAQERANREKWRLAEAKRIKESTLQSLEPDIVLLLNRHKAEKARLREEYENELRQRDEVIAAKDASVEELKSKLQREAAETLTREQEAVRQSLRDESERIQRQLADERRSEKQKREQLEHHHEDQRRTLQHEIDRLGKEVLRLQSAQTTEQASFHEAVTKEVCRITAEANERMAALKDKMLLEFTTRERDLQGENHTYLRSKEDEMRRRCEVERDAAIAKVVQRLETEHLRTLESTRGSDGMLRERYLQVTREKERLQVELDLVKEQLKSALEVSKSKTDELARIQDVADLSQQHLDAIESRVRAEYAKRMGILDQEWQRKLHEFEAQHVAEVWEQQQRQTSLGQELSRLKCDYETEKKTIEQRHHAELSQINERVLVAMTKKENTIQYQSEQLLALQEAVSVRDQELQRHKQLLL